MLMMQLESRARGLLNKMTWDTFDRLSRRLCDIEINSKVRTMGQTSLSVM
jgi:hypothetical protein